MCAQPRKGDLRDAIEYIRDAIKNKDIGNLVLDPSDHAGRASGHRGRLSGSHRLPVSPAICGGVRSARRGSYWVKSRVQILLEWINGERDATADEVMDHFTALFTAAANGAIQADESVGSRSGGKQ